MLTVVLKIQLSEIAPSSSPGKEEPLSIEPSPPKSEQYAFL